MSSRARSAERRREDDQVYEAECEVRQAQEKAFQMRFGPLMERLEALGIEPFLLAEWVREKASES